MRRPEKGEALQPTPPESQDESLSAPVVDDPDYENVFKKFDINKDGSLTSTELGAYFMVIYDEQFNQKVDDSFAKAAKSCVVKEKDFNKEDFYVPPHADFKDIDTNDDHQLTEDEVSRANILRNRYSAYNSVMGAKVNHDANSNFQLDKTEFKNLWDSRDHNRDAAMNSLKLTELDVHVRASVFEMRDYGKRSMNARWYRRLVFVD